MVVESDYKYFIWLHKNLPLNGNDNKYVYL